MEQLDRLLVCFGLRQGTVLLNGSPGSWKEEMTRSGCLMSACQRSGVLKGQVVGFDSVWRPRDRLAGKGLEEEAKFDLR
jgi:hypothetical protein